MQKRKYLKKKYQHYCEPFIVQLRKELEEGHSWNYVCRTIVGEVERVKRYYVKYPELKELHDNYINRKLDQQHRKVFEK